jgi:hypothetical protein
MTSSSLLCTEQLDLDLEFAHTPVQTTVSTAATPEFEPPPPMVVPDEKTIAARKKAKTEYMVTPVRFWHAFESVLQCEQCDSLASLSACMCDNVFLCFPCATATYIERKLYSFGCTKCDSKSRIKFAPIMKLECDISDEELCASKEYTSTAVFEFFIGRRQALLFPLQQRVRDLIREIAQA